LKGSSEYSDIAATSKDYGKIGILDLQLLQSRTNIGIIRDWVYRVSPRSHQSCACAS
jgi:hypothetical protein